MEQEGHQLIVHLHEEEEEIMEDGALIRKQSVSHSKGNFVMDEVTFTSSSSSSSSPCSNSSEHTNGVCPVVPPDGSPVQKEGEIAETGDAGENCNHVNGDQVDFAAVGLAQVAEFAGAPTNGEAINGGVVSQHTNSVYFDKQQGDEVNGINGVQNGNVSEPVHPTNLGEREFDSQADQSVIQNSLCSEITSQCMKTVDDNLPSVPKLPHINNSSDKHAKAVMNFHEETSTKETPNLIQEIDQQLEEYDVEAVLAKQETHDLFCPNCHSCITKRVILKKRKRNTQKSYSIPKRKTIDSSELVNYSAKPDSNQDDHANVTPESYVVSPEPPADDDNRPHEEPEVFRCLSCFSFFIPSGKCFDLIRNFGGASKNEGAQNCSSVPASNLQNPSNPQGSNANWFKSLITFNKGKKASDTSPEHSGTGPAEQRYPALSTSDGPTTAEINHPKRPLADTSGIQNVKPTPDINHGHGGMNSSTNGFPSIQSGTKFAGDMMNGVRERNNLQDPIDFLKEEQLLPENLLIKEGEKNASVDIIKTVMYISIFSYVMCFINSFLAHFSKSESDNVEVMPSVSISNDKAPKYESVPLAAATTETIVNSGETAKDDILKPYEGKPEFLVSATVGSQVLKESVKDVDKTREIVQNGYSSLGQGAQSPIQSSGSPIFANDVTSNKLNVIDAIFPSKPDFTLIDNVQKEIDKEINCPTGKENQGGDVIIDVGGGAFASSTSQTEDNIPAEGAIITESQTLGEQPRDEVAEPQGWEILKSIVYGGLVESITSLGIVSSAVSLGDTPLNIIALGFANIIGGLFMLCHNLINLKNDHFGEDQTQMNVQDRYQELLGRRTNFLLHAVVAVLSFLIFGAVPLVIYGILINKNYYNEVKLATVAATSVVCIILLAIGKVYTSRPPKSYIKTVLYYVTLAISAAGVSYIAGNLIKDLLEKLNHPESGFAITMPISDTSTESAWMSY
ncbi:hypothetical protein VNO78_31183 [Psophocarpus tetragonolobus]|uniref:Membrane protein of ER body-like protein n=1 Tax=Psophocarpus tetragonolobus TaxID=3891 RepID=A0AAN9RYD0_PSOTE